MLSAFSLTTHAPYDSNTGPRGRSGKEDSINRIKNCSMADKYACSSIGNLEVHFTKRLERLTLGQKYRRIRCDFADAPSHQFVIAVTRLCKFVQSEVVRIKAQVLERMYPGRGLGNDLFMISMPAGRRRHDLTISFQVKEL